MKRLRLILLVALAPSLSWAQALPAGWPEAYPVWWYQRGVIKTTGPLNADNYLLLNQGQLWNLAAQGIAELDEQLASIGGAGFDLSAFRKPGAVPDYYSPARIGQLKNVSSRFYMRFAEIGFGPTSLGWPEQMSLDAGTGFPWSVDLSPNNGSLANLGQAKFLFSWDISNWIEDDADQDGLFNGFELMAGTELLEMDSDGDGTDDFLEHRLGLDPLAQELLVDSDGDRFPNQWELWAGTDASDPASYPQEAHAGELPVENGAPAGAALFIVDPSLPDDSLPYRKKTLQAALNAIDDGDIVAIKPDTYDGPVTVPMGTTGNLENVAIVALDGGVGSGNVVIDLKGMINVDAFTVQGQSAQTTNAKSTRIIIDGLLIEGAYAAGSAAFKSTRIRGRIRNCIFRGSSQGISQNDTIYCYYENCIISGNYGYSTNAAAGFSRGTTKFKNCTFYGNRKGNFEPQKEMFRVLTDAKVYFENSIIWNESSLVDEMSIEKGKVYFSNTILRGGIAALKLAGGTYEITTPLLTSNPLLDADGRPQAGSPAIGHNNLLNRAPGYDVEKTPRYIDLPDLGAYEIADSSRKRSIDGELLIAVDSSVDPVAVTLNTSGISQSYGGYFQVFWDTDGDGDCDESGALLTSNLSDLLGQIVQVRLVSWSGEERIEVVDFRDLNSNGIPDYWDNRYFPVEGSLLTDDPDLDGADNLSEFLSNTNPLDNLDAGLNLVIYNL